MLSGQVESSRIILDPHNFNLYGTPGPGLGSIESDLTDREPLAEVGNVVYKATSLAYRQYQDALKKHKNHGDRDLSESSKFLLVDLPPSILADVLESQKLES